MIRELAHFFRHVPEVAWKSTRMSHAELFDLLMDRSDRAGFARWRERLAGEARGQVLELGCGTGRLFSYYTADARVVALEPSIPFLAIAREAASSATKESAGTITLVGGKGEQLPFADASFDAVVLCDVLCSVRDTAHSLAELKRVLRPGGELRITTHVISKKPVSRVLMHAFNPCWRLYNRVGCNMNRDTERDLTAAGFTITETAPYQIFTPGLPSFPGLFVLAHR